MGMVMLHVACGDERGWGIAAKIEAADSLFYASIPVAIAEMDRIARVKLVITFDRVLYLPVLGACVYVPIAKADRVRSGTAREGEEIAEKCSPVDFERLNS